MSPADLKLKGYIDDMAAVRAIVSDVKLHYQGVEALLQQHGVYWTPQALPDEWRNKVDAQPKFCFDNSYCLARASKGRLRYVEGYAFGVIPVEHAWCVDELGNVVDITWGQFRHEMGTAYMGVCIPLDVVKKYRSKSSTSALYNWQGRYPLLMSPFTHPQYIR